ncbi:MAG: lipase family protein [Nostoc sp. ChiQUE02]|uniref:lipase family protein n=1 Tax=Nostoc sp. ChiQUE02 TaxID=3075377 RepID=UPI002AD1E664|nr:lipase family protein [Nostoc sp. ChiQUE02]MDZ8230434.1 lipase family protein [Nostoc sp. ChiQUE02]
MTSSADANKTIERADISIFDSNYEEFNSLIAQKLAGLIQKVYEQFDEINKRKQGEKFDEINEPKLGEDYHLINELKENGLPFGFVASKKSSNDVFVVFRGTKTFAEWFQDVNIPLVSYHDGRNREGDKLDRIQLIKSPVEIPKVGDFGRVTVGFRQIYISLRDAMINALQDRDPDSRIFVTGHSLGGALATLAIPDILANTDFKPEQVILYTFASPRCGDREFATEFGAKGVKHWRIANTEDFVTMIPFPTGNIFKTTAKLPKDEEEKAIGSGEVTSKEGKPRNPNPLFGFFKAMYNRSEEILGDHKRRMPDYVHTGTPVCFTIHAAALEQHHNLEEIYMRGILRFTKSE